MSEWENPRIIPFRDSKLTRLFQNFFVGRGKAVMIVNVNQCASMFDETQYVFKFSAVASQVIVKQNPAFLKSKLPVPSHKLPPRSSIMWATTSAIRKEYEELRGQGADKNVAMHLEETKRDMDKNVHELNNKLRQRELDKNKTKMITMETDFTSEKETLLSRKDRELAEIRQQLEAVKTDLEKQEMQTQAHKQVLDKINMEKEAVEFEKEKLEKQVKRIEGECDSINNELVQVKVSVTKTQQDLDQAAKQKTDIEDQLQDITEEKHRLEKSSAELMELNKALNTEKEALHQRYRKEHETLQSTTDGLQHKLDNYDSLVQQKEQEIKDKVLQITDLENENSTLKTYKSEKERLETETLDLKDKVKKLQAQLAESETKSTVINDVESTNNNMDVDNEMVQELTEERENCQYQLNLPEGVSIDVYLTSIVDTGRVFLQQPTHPTFPSLERLNSCMNQCYHHETVPDVPKSRIESGLFCVAPLLNGWYRVQIMVYHEDTDECDIKYLDYGGCSRIASRCLKQIRSDFMTLPFEAVECYLANITPLDNESDFSSKSAVILEELVKGKTLQARVVGKAKNGLPCVHIYQISGPNETLLINRELVNRGVVRWTELMS